MKPSRENDTKNQDLNFVRLIIFEKRFTVVDHAENYFKKLIKDAFPEALRKTKKNKDSWSIVKMRQHYQ